MFPFGDARRGDLVEYRGGGATRPVHAGTTTQALGWDSNGDPLAKSLDNTYLPNRTRRIPLVPAAYTAAAAITWAVDGHGSLNQFPHIHFADAADNVLFYNGVPVPADDANLSAGDWTIKALWSSSVGGNNVYIEAVAVGYLLAGGDTTGSVPIDNTAANAADAAADKLKLTSWSFASLPGVRMLFPALFFTRTNGADTNTGQVSLYAAWLEYTADS